MIAAIIQQPSTYPLPQYRPELINRWHYVLNGMVQMGKLTQQQANAMKFPAPGDYVPQTSAPMSGIPTSSTWFTTSWSTSITSARRRSTPAGTRSVTSIDNAKMAELYQAVSDNEAQIDESSFPFDPTYMHAGAVLENPADGSIQALYPGPGYPGRSTTGPERSSPRVTARRSPAK